MTTDRTKLDRCATDKTNRAKKREMACVSRPLIWARGSRAEIYYREAGENISGLNPSGL